MSSAKWMAPVLLVALGCDGSLTPETPPSPERDRAIVVEDDGTVAIYGGLGVGDAIRGGQTVGEDFPTAFLRLRVPASFVAAAAIEADRVKTVSFEVPDPSIEATVHYWRGESDGSARLVTLYFHPGDPWVSGYAQVGTYSDGATVGPFEVIYWRKADPSLGMPALFGQEIYTGGLLGDQDMPTLLHADDPVRPPLPDSWK